MTALDTPPLAAAPVEPATRSGSLLRAEARRFRSRRFIQVLLLVLLLGYAAAVGLASATTFGKSTPAAQAQADREVQRIIAESEGFRQQCLDDPGLPPDVTPEQFCGPPLTAADLPREQFLDKEPFVLSEGLPAGALAVAVATAAVLFLIGATFVGAEWSSRSMVALLFWEPRRGRVVATKLAVLATAAAAIAAVAQALWWGTAAVMATTLGETGRLGPGFYGDLLGQQARSILLVVIAALLGFGFANLIRNTGAALGIGFVYFAVIETAVRNIRPAWQQWLLTDNAIALVMDGGYRFFIYGEPTLDSGGGLISDGAREVVLSNLHGGLVLGLASAALLAVGIVLFQRRDLH